VLLSVSIRVKPLYFVYLNMNRRLQLAAALLVAATLAPALAFSAPKPRPVREDVEWLWQYTPDDANQAGRENDLVQDLRFLPLLQQYLTAPQTFWGQPIAGRYRSLSNTALDHLSVPDKVVADANRYISISGCTVHFCPARGLLWVDLNGSHHLVVFAAIDWTKQGAPTSDPAAEYNLWLFSNDPLTSSTPAASGSAPAARIPPALSQAVGRWTAEPLAGTGIVQNITHAFIVDPDGTQHEVPPSALGIQPPTHTVPVTNPMPGANTTPDTNDNGPILKPRN
jgi:hypothetical protein